MIDSIRDFALITVAMGVTEAFWKPIAMQLALRAGRPIAKIPEVQRVMNTLDLEVPGLIEEACGEQLSMKEIKALFDAWDPAIAEAKLSHLTRSVPCHPAEDHG